MHPVVGLVAVVAAAVAAVAIAALCSQEALHQRPRLTARHLLLAVPPEISREAHYWWIVRNSFVWEGFVNAVAKHLALPPYSLTRRLTQQDFQTEGETVSAADGCHPYIQTMEAVLELVLERVKVQNAFPACLVRDSVTASALSSAGILVREKVGLVGHAEAAEVV